MLTDYLLTDNIHTAHHTNISCYQLPVNYVIKAHHAIASNQRHACICQVSIGTQKKVTQDSSVLQKSDAMCRAVSLAKANWPQH